MFESHPNGQSPASPPQTPVPLSGLAVGSDWPHCTKHREGRQRWVLTLQAELSSKMGRLDREALTPSVSLPILSAVAADAESKPPSCRKKKKKKKYKTANVANAGLCLPLAVNLDQNALPAVTETHNFSSKKINKNFLTLSDLRGF